GLPIRRRVRTVLHRVALLLEPLRLPALAAALPHIERLPADTVPRAQLRHRKGSRLVLTKQPDTLLHRTALPERHRPILLRIRRSLPVRNQPGLKRQDSARFIPSWTPTPNPSPQGGGERTAFAAELDVHLYVWSSPLCPCMLR